MVVAFNVANFMYVTVTSYDSGTGAVVGEAYSIGAGRAVDVAM